MGNKGDGSLLGVLGVAGSSRSPGVYALNTKGASTGSLPVVGAMLIASSSYGGGRNSIGMSRLTRGGDGVCIMNTSSVSGSMMIAISSDGGGSIDCSACKEDILLLESELQ